MIKIKQKSRPGIITIMLPGVLGKETEEYNRLVEQAADKNRRFISVNLDEDSGEKSTTIACDDIDRIWRE